MSTDCIEKKIFLRAPRSRVWNAIANSNQFGEWFRVKFEGPFIAGSSIKGQILQPGYEHIVFNLEIEAIEPERRFACRWHPYSVDPAVDYSSEPTTLIEFILTEAEGGTLLTLTECGFDRIPEHRRAEAFLRNDGGWTQQMKNIEAYVTRA